jgi:hypothetical protein
MPEIGISRNCFPKGKPVDQVHESVDRGQRRSTMDHGHRLGGGSSENGRNCAPVHGTLPRLRKKGQGTAVSLTAARGGGGGSDTAGRQWGTIGEGGAWWGGHCRLGSEQMRAG